MKQVILRIAINLAYHKAQASWKAADAARAHAAHAAHASHAAYAADAAHAAEAARIAYNDWQRVVAEDPCGTTTKDLK